MELLDCNKNIWTDEIIEENDEFGMEELEAEENDENIEQMGENGNDEEEPDFMDNSGQFWKFGCRIRDDQHLKEWCRKMGGMRIGKEEKFTRRFDCPMENCQFQTILLKSINILYSRNEHNHEVESLKMDDENYGYGKIEMYIADKGVQKHKYPQLQKHYHFYGQILNEEQLRELIGENGLIPNGTYGSRLYYRCIRNKNTANVNQKCKFHAIFDRKNGTFYTTKWGHNHSLGQAEPKKPLFEVGDDYEDEYGKIWKFHKKIGKNAPHRIFSEEFGFTSVRGRQNTVKMYCRKNGPNGKCQFEGIYLATNGYLYTRGAHEHGLGERNAVKKENIAENEQISMVECGQLDGANKRAVKNRGKQKFFKTSESVKSFILIKKLLPKIGENYLDKMGRLWEFNSEIGKVDSNRIFHKKFGFTTISKKQTTLNLHCYKNGPNGKCKFAGVYLKANGCLYTRGEHVKHLKKKKSTPKIGEDYVDHLGKLWKFEAEIGKNPERRIFRMQFGFTQISPNKSTLNFYCYINGPSGRCNFAGVYLEGNGCLYTRGKHEHGEMSETNSN